MAVRLKEIATSIQHTGPWEEVPATDQSFCIDEVNFAIEPSIIEPSIKEQLESVTLIAGPQGFKLEGFQSSDCC